MGGLTCNVLHFCIVGVCASVHRACDQKTQGANKDISRSSNDSAQEGREAQREQAAMEALGDAVHMCAARDEWSPGLGR